MEWDKMPILVVQELAKLKEHLFNGKINVMI